MFITNRKIALDKIRDTLAGIASNPIVDDRIKAETLWLTGAVDLLSTLENKQVYFELYAQAVKLAKEGLRFKPDGDLSMLMESYPEEWDSRFGLEEIEPAFDGVVSCLSSVIKNIGNDSVVEASGYFSRLAQWEMSLYELYSFKGPARNDALSAFTQETLKTYLQQRLPEENNLQVKFVKLLYGGFSKQTVLVTAQGESQQHELVIRAERSANLVHFDGADIVREFNCVSYLFQQDRLPVAEPLWVEEDTEIFGTRFMVSQRMKGENLGTSLSSLATMSPEIRHSIFATLGKIHTQEIQRENPFVKKSHLHYWTQFSSTEDSTRALLENWKTEFDRAATPTTPVIEYIYAWLLDNIPREALKPVLVHGDYGLANVMFHQGQVSAVLDWELSYLGDPCGDLINFMNCYDRQVLDIYEKESGQYISEYRLTYFLIFNMLRGVHCMIGMNKLESDKNATVNYYLLPANLYTLIKPVLPLMERMKKLKNTG